jgi:hypothetical protein
MKTPINPFKQALRDGRPQIGLWVGLADPYAIEAMAGVQHRRRRGAVGLKRKQSGTEAGLASLGVLRSSSSKMMLGDDLAAAR